MSVIRVGRGVPGRQRIPVWAVWLSELCQGLLLAGLLFVGLVAR